MSFALGQPDRATLVTFVGTEFIGEEGIERGTLNCIFEGDTTRLWTLSVSLEGEGIQLNFPSSPILDKPAGQKSSSFSTDIFP